MVIVVERIDVGLLGGIGVRGHELAKKTNENYSHLTGRTFTSANKLPRILVLPQFQGSSFRAELNNPPYLDKSTCVAINAYNFVNLGLKLSKNAVGAPNWLMLPPPDIAST